MRSGPRFARSLAALLLVVVAACGDDDPGRTTAATTSTSAVPTTTTTTAAPDTTTTTTTTTAVVTTTVPATPAPAPDAWLRQGTAGAEVLRLQERLAELGYWLGTPDGTFGEDTHHAVVALQKVAGLGRDGVVGPATLDALDRGVRPAAESTTGRVVEIDLHRQVLLAVDDGVVRHTFDTSTGRVPGTTPVGHWTVTRQIDGLRRSELGLLYRPKYFYGGVAIHGYTSVPPYAVSHGCVRVTYPAMDAIWAMELAPVGTPVWVR